MSLPAALPAQLARFPDHVHQAYRKFLSDGDEAALRAIVHAALLDFLPKRSGASAGQLEQPGVRLIEDLGFDSLAIAELVFFFEDLFKVMITSDEIRGVRTVEDLHAFVGGKLTGWRVLE
jgi:acyl carrier protein